MNGPTLKRQTRNMTRSFQSRPVRPCGDNRRSGIILLVVLSMLAFLGILVVTYVTYTSSSRQSAFGIASREMRKTEPSEDFKDAVATLIRGTSDPLHPMYGEDLLSDLYGITDAVQTAVREIDQTGPFNESSVAADRPMHVGGGFVRIPLSFFQHNENGIRQVLNLTTPNPNDTWAMPLFGTYPDDHANTPNEQINPRDSVFGVDDFFSGRVLTLASGPLAGNSFRIIRSIGWRPDAANDRSTRLSVYIALDPDLQVALSDGTELTVGDLFNFPNATNPDPYAVSALFYASTTPGWMSTRQYANAGAAGETGFRLIINGQPMNGGGVGFDGNNVDQDTPVPYADSTAAIPVAFQPRAVDSNRNLFNPSFPRQGPLAVKSADMEYLNQANNQFRMVQGIDGDYDESYDAADFQNWFLSHTYVDGNGQRRIIPSFHRPALINYIVNQYDLSSASRAELETIVEAIRRATFRPLSFAQGQFSDANNNVLPNAINPQFNGGNTDPAFSTPLLVDRDAGSTGSIPQMIGLDQLVNALVNGPWDVDNDGDGVPDSIWVDFGLPTKTAPDGRLIKPLVAPLIEDLSARLNVNAHGTIDSPVDLSSSENEPWFDPTPRTGNNVNREIYRGIGFGPAEIVLPYGNVVHADAQVLAGGTQYSNLLTGRYQNRLGIAPAWPYAYPGLQGNDLLDSLINRPRVGSRWLGAGTGLSADPFGRGGYGLSRSGRLFVAGSGTIVRNYDAGPPVRTQIDENIDDPYEMDPRGVLSGDNAYRTKDMVGLADQSLFSRMEQISRLTGLPASAARNLTTVSTSLDVPAALPPEGSRSQGAPLALMEMLLQRLNSDGRISSETDLQNEQAYLDAILPRELKLGQKLDLNRPFGNGVDDAFGQLAADTIENGRGSRSGVDDNANGSTDEASEGNGVIDEPLEVYYETRAYPNAGNANNTATYLSNVRPSGTNGIDGPSYNVALENPRTLLARNIYVLMMAITGDGYDFPVADQGNTDPAEYRARRLAQWAVNVVDYRDPDSIMTPFVYDRNPLDGNWNVTYDTDGDGYANIDFDGNTVTGNQPASPMVWGVESPDLLFSESLALHDVRVRDTKQEGGGSGSDKSDTPPDPDTDQLRIPQGSLFLELFNPRQRVLNNNDQQHAPGLPMELYRYQGGQYRLELDKTVTTPSTNGVVEVPVWRIAISEPHYDGANSPNDREISPQYIRDQIQSGTLNLADSYSFDPGTPRNPIGTQYNDGNSQHTQNFRPFDELNQDNRRLNLERFIFFTDYGSVAELENVTHVMPWLTGDPNRVARVFFNRSGSNNARLLGEQYLTLAPRPVTYLGSQVSSGDVAPAGNSPQRFEISNANPVIGLAHYNFDTTPLNTPNTTSLSQPGLSLIMGAFAEPLGWQATARPVHGIGLNISEPLPTPTGYYPEPTAQYDSSNSTEYPLIDSYIDWDDPINDPPRDQPLDLLLSNAPVGDLTLDLATSANPAEPMLGTVKNYRTAFLQRLADPTRAFDRVTNPYITIDQMTLDLTVFSGEESESNVGPPAVNGNDVDTRYLAGSRQRTGVPSNGTGSHVLFSYTVNDPATLPIDTTASTYFAFADSDGDTNPEGLDHTFNFLNLAFGDVRNPANSNGVVADDVTVVETGANSNRGLPLTPFAVHEWLNRDFASPMEVMMVPACSQGRLFEEFTLNDASATNSPYDPNASSDPPTTFRAPFGHLLNFFQSDETEDDASQALRIFDFVATPPRYRGEIEFINPERVPYVPNPNSTFLHARKKLSDYLLPPHNKIWDGRRQGRLNLNTIGEYPVWMGLMFNHLSSSERTQTAQGSTRYQEFLESRRGYTPAGGNASRIVDTTTLPPQIQSQPYNFDPNSLTEDSPTQFAGIFRTSLDADLAPTLSGGNANALRNRTPAEGTIARAGETSDFDPLFTPDGAGPAHADRSRSSFMDLHSLVRIPNLVSTQSQTFMVRMTIGYFEVDSATSQLGQEYNADIGRQRRYRATYVIDRSIPVGFAGPGTDINAANTVIYSQVEK
ncbi:hypothetical protein [Crateriforma spongiae]|uniref:hypothetical protein n=1 Tax=Crateriforma spongiae TaxID=2724528 RepID=UPI0014489687|nr:hypothetical protein [Crateriforma spongiae]